jgi:hypothetical protein
MSNVCDNIMGQFDWIASSDHFGINKSIDLDLYIQLLLDTLYHKKSRDFNNIDSHIQSKYFQRDPPVGRRPIKYFILGFR